MTEPIPAGLGVVHEHGRSVRVTWHGRPLARYVYVPWEAQLESPRPYVHPLWTLDGRPVSLYRPHDHVWHKGISLALSNVGTENFWGGPTYLRAEGGYAQLPNNGTQAHEAFDEVGVADGVVTIAQRLRWVTEAGASVLTERRRITFDADPDSGAWRLGFTSTVDNVSGVPIPFGSPTTEGRPDAGYSGLFWRGPRSFSGGGVLTPDRAGADDLNGTVAPWMAFTGRHDGDGTHSTLLFVNRPGPVEWFVRSEVFAVVCPAPFFSAVHTLPAGGTLEFAHDVWVADGALDAAACEQLAKREPPA
ncbi:hypothetical protein Val02_62020 [Virgisporangium aliadipatigenens]|uniref:Methane oxygenase PmoA n=1 Tax=Virgisporangium aliadipatigenens TaxID=741659 RepID=A0A8J4DTI0_9ACTN|nr:PmoA family protein [Virgisporangium aliadipatigenens]GIJ49316.1 hypothetical protein Val02_62020 [Virgisporangium aliadipatigenens]